MAHDDLARIAGLPEELGIDEELDKEAQHLRIRMDTRRYGKAVTIVEGFHTDIIDLAQLASNLKRKLATGGTVEDDTIELQGDHTRKLRTILEDQGYLVE